MIQTFCIKISKVYGCLKAFEIGDIVELPRSVCLEDEHNWSELGSKSDKKRLDFGRSAKKKNL